MQESLIERVTAVIARTQKLPPASITVDSTFAELNIDSLDGINILFALEGEFNIEIPDDAARNIVSVRQLAEGIEQLLAAKQFAAEQGDGIPLPPDPPAPSAGGTGVPETR